MTEVAVISVKPTGDDQPSQTAPVRLVSAR
jgi:hypothetical protein